jgi:hypothetical protein
MDFQSREIPLLNPAYSLCFNGDSLMDWAGGNRIIGMDGEKPRTVGISWGYRFNAAVQSPSGRFAVIYERLGTKGLLLDRGKLLREIDRSFYCADCYEYPVLLFDGPGGRTLLAHCPREYNQIEIEDALTGERLTKQRAEKPDDFFHSRLSVSPDGGRLMSAGWVWHPCNSVSIWSVRDALTNGAVLDSTGPKAPMAMEINSATFVDADRVVLSWDKDPAGLPEGAHGQFRPGNLVVFNIETGSFESIVTMSEPVGTMLSLGDGRVVGFYEHPKLINVRTGAIEHRWPELATGKQNSSILAEDQELPPIALDPVRRRFAVAAKDRITVVQF